MKKAYTDETNGMNEKYNSDNYKDLRDFIELLSTFDKDAVVNYGPWMPPITNIQWKNDRWWEQETQSRKFYSDAGCFNKQLFELTHFHDIYRFNT